MIQILGLFGMYFDVVVVEVKTSLLGSGHTVFDLGDLRRGSGKFFKNYITKTDGVCHSFLVKIVTKSLHRGGGVVSPNKMRHCH